MSRSMVLHAAMLAGLLVAAAAGAADDDVTWIADRNGCKVANPFPQPGESIAWDGPCRKGLADGDGVLQWFVDDKPADKYEGTLKDGWAEGKGTLTRAQGGRYVGDWQHSLQDGDGRYEAPDGSWYEGQWKEGQPHGHGQYQTPDGRLFVGEWVNGVYEGDMDDNGDDDNPNRT
ncbi:MAG TPA: hypothetical protein VFV71_02410 [Burkholderiales bacterium]|nr:hypothetical protein [Burkholderiales bacterium]